MVTDLLRESTLVLRTEWRYVQRMLGAGPAAPKPEHGLRCFEIVICA